MGKMWLNIKGGDFCVTFIICKDYKNKMDNLCLNFIPLNFSSQNNI